MNMKYGKLVQGVISYAPTSVMVDGALKVNPSEATYLAAGWKKVIDEKPEVSLGMDLALSRWVEDETTLKAVYKQVVHKTNNLETDKSSSGETTKRETSVVGRRIFSKLKLVAALKAADKWVLVKTWLEEKSYYDFYLAAQEFREEYPVFQEGLKALMDYAHLGADEVEAILAQCVADE
jgi:hypothetical protein